MRVILIDDEPLALMHLGNLLEERDGIEVIGQYDHPLLALEATLIEEPDVVFLDIDMPEINGIELAEKIQNACPEIIIVFVTAYDQYAVKAFDLNAIDYIIKPIQRKRLDETIRRLMKEDSLEKDPSDKVGVVCCFQGLQFKKSFNDIKVIEAHWRTSKARELFSFLLQNRGNSVRKDMILDLLWPEFDENKGYAQLYTTVYQIRKTLSAINIHITISSYDNSYILELNDVKLDIDEWEKRMKDITAGLNDQFKYQNVLHLYRGDYFSEEAYLWAESERERLRVLWIYYINKISDYLIFQEKYTEAILLYKRAQILHPFMEENYFMLMKLYDLSGDSYAVIQQYNQLRDMLIREYDSGPSKSIETWYKRWKGKETVKR